MKVALLHARAMTVELVRFPAYLIPTLLLPAVFFLFFAGKGTGTRAVAAGRMATFAGFAVIGVAFFQFGVGIAADRGAAWETYLRTLPVAPLARLVARLLSASVFALAAAGVLVVAALATTPVELTAAEWGAVAATLLVGAVPFGLLGIALGYWAPAKGALPLANLLYLVLSYAGGLWERPAHLPHLVARLSPFLPTRALADALVAAAAGAPVAWRAWLGLGVFAVCFGAAALSGYRRDEARRFA